MKRADDVGPAIVQVNGVSVRYGDLVAVDNVDLSVASGEIVGVIGPNGAGKTSLLECVEGLRQPDAGQIRVAGLDPLTDRSAMVQLAGVQLQHSAYPPRASVDDVCRLFTAFYPNRPDYRPLIDEFGLNDQRRSQVTKLSGGERQRLSLVLALLGEPKVVFLDELTTGLDPVARRTVWEALRQRNAEGLTIMVTSHFMEEVEYLCDRVAVLVRGRLVALDTVAALIRDHAPGVRIVVERGAADAALGDELDRLGSAIRVTPAGNRLLIQVLDTDQRPRVDRLLVEHAASTRTLPTSLEDVYVELTGQIVTTEQVSN